MGEFFGGIDTWVQDTTGLSAVAQGRLVETAVIIVTLWALRVLTLRVVTRRQDKADSSHEDKAKTSYQWRKGTAYVTYILAFLLIGRVWIESFESLATVVGLVSAGIAVALKDPLLNLAGWLFIVWRKPFEVGDRVEVGSYRGDIVDQGVFTFSLMEIGNWVQADDRTGRLLIAPNGVVFTDIVANYSKGWFEQIWNELQVVVTFESNWREAQKLLVDIAEAHGRLPDEVSERLGRRGSHQYVVLTTNFEPRVFVTVEAIGVGLTIRYLCKPFERRRSAEAIWVDVLDAFAAREDIDFAYPTMRYYDNLHEGKAEARAELRGPAPRLS